MFGWDDEEHTDAVPGDRFDETAWNEMRMESLLIEEMVKDLGRTHSYVEDLTRDTFMQLVKALPRIREPEEMRASHIPLRESTEMLSGLPELEGLRQHTVGDAFNSMMAMGPLRPVIEEALKNAERLQEQAEQAQAAADAANEAAANGDPDADDLAADAASKAHQLLADAAAGVAGARRAARKAVQGAADEIEEQEAMAAAYGTNPSDLKRMPTSERLALARRFERSPKLREFAKLIGQFKTLMVAEYRRRYADGADEIVGMKLGDDLTRLTGQELLNLASPELEDDFWTRYANRELWVHELRGRERVGKGPIVVVADESASMGGEGEMWAKGLALALLERARIEKRDFHYIGFAHRDLREFDFPGGKVDTDRVLELATGFLNGGTEFGKPLRRALDIIQAAGKEKPDIVFITDGEAAQISFLDEWRTTRERLSVKCFGIFVGAHGGLETISALADNVRGVLDLTDVTQVADIMRG